MTDSNNRRTLSLEEVARIRYEATRDHYPVLVVADAIQRLGGPKTDGPDFHIDEHVARVIEAAEQMKVSPFELDPPSLDAAEERTPNLIEVGGVTIDPRAMKVMEDGREIDLPRNQYRLLLHLLTHPNEVLLYETLLQDIWHSPLEAKKTRTYAAHMKRLRAKLPSLAGKLRTVRGIGYIYRPDSVTDE